MKKDKNISRSAVLDITRCNPSSEIRAVAVRLKKEVGEQKFEKGNYERAAKMFEEMSVANQFEDFLTVPAYL